MTIECFAFASTSSKCHNCSWQSRSSRLITSNFLFRLYKLSSFASVCWARPKLQFDKELMDAMFTPRSLEPNHWASRNRSPRASLNIRIVCRCWGARTPTATPRRSWTGPKPQGALLWGGFLHRVSFLTCFEMCFHAVFLFEHESGDWREAFVCWTTAEPTTLPGNLGFYHAATVHEDKSSKILPRSAVKGSYPSLFLVHFLICNMTVFKKTWYPAAKACLFPPKSQSPPSGRPTQPLSQAIVLTKLAISTEVDEK